MDMKRKITLGAATLAVALGAGHLVQSGRPGAAAVGVADAASVKPTGITPLAASSEPEDLPSTVPPAPLAASLGSTPQAQVPPAAAATVAKTAPQAAPAPVSLTPPPPAATKPAPVVQADDCHVTLDVMAAANGMLDLTLLAPCKPGTRVVLRHGGLAVTGRTSTGGALFTALPAMEPDGAVSAMFPDGTIARAAAPVDLTGIQRFAVQWMADDRFALNAYQGGAAWGALGHVHAGARGLPQDKSGWMMPLGDASVDLPMMAEVYTWPAATADIAIDIEAPVTETTCDRELLGETLQSQSGRVTRSDITLATPDCSAVGDFLVLNNLLSGTTTAAAD